MSQEVTLRKGDIGTVFNLTITDETGTAINLSSYDTDASKAEVTDPDGNVAQYTLTFPDAANGVVRFTAGDIWDAKGRWLVRCLLVIDASNTWRSEPLEVLVEPAGAPSA